MEINFPETKKALENAGFTVTSWARTRGFKTTTMLQLLNGTYPYPKGPTPQKAIERLRQEGLLVETSAAA